MDNDLGMNFAPLIMITFAIYRRYRYINKAIQLQEHV